MLSKREGIQVKTLTFVARVPVSIEVQAEKNEYGDIVIKNILNVSLPSLSDVTESMDVDELEEFDKLFNEECE
jgi:hypothetical protein